MESNVNLNSKTALVVIDVQQGFDDPQWGERNNPQAEANIERLLGAWRAASLPVFHIQHDSLAPTGFFRPGAPGHCAKKEAVPLPGEPVYHKSVNSGFIGTNLGPDLTAQAITGLVFTGLTTNHCVSTTTRMAGNLGYDSYVVADATATFERAHLDGRMRSAEEVHLAALSDLAGEFATVIGTEDALSAATAFAASRASAPTMD
jgi:nicotinamidase-related amidase